MYSLLDISLRLNTPKPYLMYKGYMNARLKCDENNHLKLQ